jgi:hypothetical protein
LKRAIALAVVVAAAAVIAAWAEEAPVTVDSIVATVHNDIITLEDIRLEGDILRHNGLWFTQVEPPAEITPKLVFEEILARRLLYFQAVKMGFVDVPDSDLNEEAEAFRSSFSNLDEYRAWLRKFELRDEDVAISDLPAYASYPSIRQRFRQRLVIEQYLSKKIGIQIKIGLSDYFEEHRAALVAAHPGDTPEHLRELARRQFYLERLQAHLLELRAQTTVVILRAEFR